MSRNKSQQKAVDQKSRDGFANFTARMGLGADNVFSDGMYIASAISNNRIQLENIYRTSWIGGKVVDDYAEDMTRAGIDITGVDAETRTNIERSLVRLDCWNALTDCIRWSRLYGGAIGVLMIDGQDMATPLRIETVGKGQFNGVCVYDRWQVSPDLTRIIQGGPDIGLPEFYRVITGWRGAKASSYGQDIHHSRVMRFCGIKLPFFQAQMLEMWGESVLERLYDRLLAYDTATAGTANMIQRAHLRHVGIKGLRDILAMGGKAEENLVTMFQYVRQLQISEGLTLLDSDDEMTYNSYTFSGLDSVLLQFGQQISGACGIPLVRLFGQSPAGLSSTGDSDIRNYYDNISAQQESKLRTPVDKLLSVLYRSLFGQPRPEDMDFTFSPLWQMSDTEKATLAKTVTEAVSLAYNDSLIDSVTATKELAAIADESGVFGNITPEYIAQLENEPEMPKVEIGANEA